MAKNLQNEQIEEYGKRRRQRRVLKRVLIGASLCVAFLAVYALVLPASTLEHPEPACGLEEHEHTEACFETQLVCQLPETGAHVHTQACYDAEDVTKLICEKPATGHLHTQKCFATGEELVCENTEADHEHGDECYLEEGTLVCEEEETVHVHTDACYELVEPEGADGQEAVEGDNAQAAEDLEGAEAQADVESAEAQPDSDSALDADVEASDPVDQKPEYRLTCDKEADGHVHFSQCYDDEGNLTCTEEEAVEVAHEHEDACSEEVAVCGLEAHNHDEVCYDPETLQMIQATKENKEAQEAEEAAKAEEAEAAPEPVSDDELEALKAKGLAWENENMVVTFTLPEDTKEEVRFQVTEQPVAESDLSEEVKADENAWQNNLHIEAAKAGEVVEDIAELNASLQIQVKPEAVEPILDEIDYDEVAEEVKDEIGVEVTFIQEPGNLADKSISEHQGALSESFVIAYESENAYALSLEENDVVVRAEMTPEPNFVVSYWANIEVIDRLASSPSNSEALHVIDASSELPTNESVKNNTVASTYVALDNSSPKGYTVKTQPKWEKIYTDKKCNYISEPNLTYFNKLYENGNYILSSIQVMQPGESNYKTYSNPFEMHFTNRVAISSTRDNYILIQEGTKIKLMFEVSNGSHDINAEFYDYDISDGYIYKTQNAALTQSEDGENRRRTSEQNNTDTWYANTSHFGINDSSHFDGAAESDARYAFGNSNAGTDFGDQAFKDKSNLLINVNKANAVSSDSSKKTVFQKCAFGLVQGIDFNTDSVVFSDGIVGPTIFGSAETIGKTTYNDFSIGYSRSGDTYEIENLKQGENPVLSNLNIFSHKSTIWGLDTKQYANDFWAMDTVQTFGSDGHDLRFGNKSLKSKRNSHIETLPTIDDYFEKDNTKIEDEPRQNVDHNSYFGMMSQVDFSLVEDYCGPLDYFFFGDDDMWVFLLELDEKGNVKEDVPPVLVCDIGGVHQTTGEYVDLWKYIEKGSEGKWALRFYYTERGASGSTCYMRFTLPSVSNQTPEQNTGSIQVEKKVDAPGNADAKERDFKFNVKLEDSSGMELPDDYSYEKTDADGNVTHGLVIHTGGSFRLKEGERVVIKYVPIGTKYTITEVCDVDGQEKEMSIEQGGFLPTYEYQVGDIVAGSKVSAKFEGTVEANDKNVIRKLVFTNKIPYELPATGGIGPEVLMLVGGMLVVAAAGLNVRRRRLSQTKCSQLYHPFSEKSESRYSRRPNPVRRGARTR